MAQNVPIDVDQNSDIVFEWICTDLNGNPLDFTGAQIVMTCRASMTDPSAAVVLSTDNGTIDVSDPTTGIFTTWFKSQVTAAVNPQTYTYNVIAVYTTGITTRIAEGYFTINPQVPPETANVTVS